MPLFAATVWESATKRAGDSVLHSVGVRLLGETNRDRMAVFRIISYDVTFLVITRFLGSTNGGGLLCELECLVSCKLLTGYFSDLRNVCVLRTRRARENDCLKSRYTKAARIM